MRRGPALALALALVGAGIALRLPHWPLPLPAHHYGGGFLWGGMVCALAAAVRPPRARAVFAPATAFALILVVEGTRLVHAPGLDAFRQTLAGQWLLGRVFSPWNIVADGLGALAAAGALAMMARGD